MWIKSLSLFVMVGEERGYAHWVVLERFEKNFDFCFIYVIFAHF